MPSPGALRVPKATALRALGIRDDALDGPYVIVWRLIPATGS